MSRLGIATAIYVVLGVLAWYTLEDQKVRIVTLAVLAMFAVRSYTHSRRQALKEQEAERNEAKRDLSGRE